MLISVWFSCVFVYTCTLVEYRCCCLKVSYIVLLPYPLETETSKQTQSSLMQFVPLSTLLLVPPSASSIWFRNHRKAGGLTWHWCCWRKLRPLAFLQHLNHGTPQWSRVTDLFIFILCVLILCLDECMSSTCKLGAHGTQMGQILCICGWLCAVMWVWAPNPDPV